MGSGRTGFWLLVALLALAAGAKAVLYDTLDPDLFWHLRVGDELATQGFVHPMVDDLAFASIKTPWSPYSWLADLFIKRLWDAGGFRAAVLAQAVLTAALVIFIALSALELSIARRGEPRYLAAALAAFAAEFLCLPYLSFRPVTMALVLLAIVACLIQRDRRLENKSRTLWLVIPLTALLVNIHLYAIFVPIALGAMATGAWMDRMPAQRYARLTLATAAACLMTPMLPGAVAAAWHYQFQDVMVAHRMIAEMYPFYHGTMGWAAAGVVILVLGFSIINRGELTWGDRLWIIFSLIVLMRLGRFAPIFAIFACPAFALTAPRLSDHLLGRVWVRAALALVLIGGLCRVGGAFPRPEVSLSQWINRMGPTLPGYPTSATDYVQAQVTPRTHRIISEFTWGGYLEWRMGANWQVLMDGRTQLFSNDFWRVVYLDAPAARRAYLAGITADAAVLPENGSAFRQDLLDLGWTIAWSDQRAVVLVPPPRQEPPSPHMVLAY